MAEARDKKVDNKAEPATVESVYSAQCAALKSALSGGSDIVNVIKDFPWSINYNSTCPSTKLPAVYVKEYRQNLSTFSSSIVWMKKALLDGSIDEEQVEEFLGNAGKGTSKAETIAENASSFNALLKYGGTTLDPYRYMYSVESTDCLNYVFPYFEESDISFSNTYGDDPQFSSVAHNTFNELTGKTGLMGLISNIQGIGNAVSAFVTEDAWINKGIYLERPKYFQVSETGDTLTVRFVLYNTIKSDTSNPWVKNYYFIKNFAFKNLPYKLSAFKFKTPMLYSVSLPGIKYFPLSYVSQFSVKSVGVRHLLVKPDGGEVNVPEAWEISITFTSLFGQSANLAEAAFNASNKIKVRSV